MACTNNIEKCITNTIDDGIYNVFLHIDHIAFTNIIEIHVYYIIKSNFLPNQNRVNTCSRFTPTAANLSSKYFL